MLSSRFDHICLVGVGLLSAVLFSSGSAQSPTSNTATVTHASSSRRTFARSGCERCKCQENANLEHSKEMSSMEECEAAAKTNGNRFYNFAVDTKRCWHGASCTIVHGTKWNWMIYDQAEEQTERRLQLFGTPVQNLTSDFEVEHANVCRGTQVEFGNCPISSSCQDCIPIPCRLGHWSQWSDCDCSGLRTRSRTVIQDKNSCGRPCEGILSETQKCTHVHCRTPKDGVMGEWTPWKACVNYQQVRTRQIERLPENGGKSLDGLPLTEMTPCGNPPAPPREKDCLITEWQEWSDCSVSCGVGRRTRIRKILQDAQYGGRPCSETLSYTERCGDDNHQSRLCPNDDDCVWGQWQEWGACSCTCGGGQHQRERMIAQSPKGMGMLCPAKSKVEIAPCNTHSCDRRGHDGQWSEWDPWGLCSEECNGGVQERKRRVVIYATGGGMPAQGASQEFRPCNSDVPCDDNRDCTFNPWGSWSACSCTCNGIQHRARTIASFGKGDGKACTGGVHEIQPCNNGGTMPAACGVAAIDCLLGQWEEWSACSVTCGLGQKQHTRRVVQEASGGGRSCEGVLTELADCQLEQCFREEKVDCIWGAWEAWGHCDLCTGEMRRFRHIHKMPENGGAPCDARSAEEMKPCLNGRERQCGESYLCNWAGWAPWDQSACSGDCQNKGTMKRDRNMISFTCHRHCRHYFVKVAKEVSCARTTQHQEQVCPIPRSCVEQGEEPVDCRLSTWSPWSACDCTGLRNRQRQVDMHNNENGNPCNDILAETQRCQPTCRQPPQDCVFGAWQAWSYCSSGQGMTGQKWRVRPIATEADRGGKPCEGIVNQTIPCGPHSSEVGAQDCVLSHWTPWSHCSVSCGAGTSERARQISVPSANGGKPCEGALRETRDCKGYHKCVSGLPCKWGSWNEWSDCTRTCGGGQKRRSRQIKQYPTGNEDMCPAKPTVEITPCNDQSCSGECINGVWAPWQEWRACSQSCGGGIRMRTREVAQPASACGVPVAGNATQAELCNTGSCEVHLDCRFSIWEEWSDCSCTCNGVRHRSRSISVYGKGNGRFCEGPIHEITACNEGPNVVGCSDPSGDCVMGSWSEWGACSASCGAGQRTRNRDIASPAFGGGKPCEASSLMEMGSCMATAAGHIVECDQKPIQDCEWSSWGEWGHCDKCGGQKRRFRYITQMPENGGRPCGSGPTNDVTVIAEEIAKCPRQCHEATYCAWSDWGSWGACPRTCTVQSRKRERRLMLTHVEPFDTEAKFSMLTARKNNMEQWVGYSNKFAIFSVAVALFLFRTLWVTRSRAMKAGSRIAVAEQHCGISEAAPLTFARNPEPPSTEVELSRQPLIVSA